MKQKTVAKHSQHIVSKETQTASTPQLFLVWKYKLNEETQKNELDSIKLSNGKELDADSLISAFKSATGTSNLVVGEKIMQKIAYGMAAEMPETRLNEVSTLLPALKPGDETEALLLGQFLALQNSGMKCLRHANLPDQGFYHEERYFLLANKLFNAANQTMQTLLKYRSGGKQTVQVIHVHNEGQAIVAQNISSNASDGGNSKKTTTEPHGSL